MNDRPGRVRHLTLAQIFAVPALIAGLVGVGLVSALVGDGIWDALSWILLALPIAVLTARLLLAR